MTDTTGTIRDFLLREVLPGERPENLRDDTPLRGGGILNSIEMLKLVDFLEQQFDIRIEAHETDDQNFGNLERLAAFVERRRKA